MEGVKNGIDPNLAGIDFIPAIQASAKGMTQFLWGVSLRPDKMQFHTREELDGEIDKLDTVRAEPIYLVDETKGEAKSVDDYRAIVSNVTKKVYSVRSAKYVPVQDAMVARPCLRAAIELDMQTIGRIDGVGTGRTNAHIALTNVKKINFGEYGRADYVALLLYWWNSYTGQTSFGGKICGVRELCNNYMPLGSELGIFKRSHIGELKGMEQGFKNLILECANKIEGLVKKVQKAKSQLIVRAEVGDALWALPELSPSVIDDISAAPQLYTPEVGLEPELNLWNLYNTVTAYITWRDKSATNLKRIDQIGESALRLLNENADRLITEGREAREAWQEGEKVKLEKKQAREMLAAQEVREKLLHGDEEQW